MTRTVSLPTGETVPALGLGTWQMGESSARRAAEIAAIRTAIECGCRLFDTAEMYGDAEVVLGRALAEALRAGDVERDDLVVISKVLPSHADRAGVATACDRSRRRLGLDTIDVYLLHWRGGVALHETVEAFASLRTAAAIRHWGVSNFDVDDLEELDAAGACATNQVLYALDERGPEFSLLAFQRTWRMPTMAYCPLGRGSLARDRTLLRLAEARGATAAQVALAWTLRQPDVIAIPKSSSRAHVVENFAAGDLALTPDELAALDEAFPPPRSKQPLAMV